MPENKFNTDGLTDAQVIAAAKRHGQNVLNYKKPKRFKAFVLGFVKEPMMVLLLIAATIYFISGKISDGIFLLAAIALISAISSFQNARSRNALEKLKDFTKPKCKVIRNGAITEIKTEQVVIGACRRRQLYPSRCHNHPF